MKKTAYDIYPIINDSPDLGFGSIGELEDSVSLSEFISNLKSMLELDSIKVSRSSEVKIQRVAFCAGSGVSFYADTIGKDADIYITGDVKHHDFRQAGIQRTILADATHIGTERFVPDVMSDVFKKAFSNTIRISTSRFKPVNAITI